MREIMVCCFWCLFVVFSRFLRVASVMFLSVAGHLVLMGKAVLEVVGEDGVVELLVDITSSLRVAGNNDTVTGEDAIRLIARLILDGSAKLKRLGRTKRLIIAIAPGNPMLKLPSSCSAVYDVDTIVACITKDTSISIESTIQQLQVMNPNIDFSRIDIF